MRQYIPLIRFVQLLLDLAVAQVFLFELTTRKLNGDFPDHYQVLVLISTLLMIVVYQWARVYHHFRAGSFMGEAQALLRAWFFVLLGLTMVGFGTKTTDMFSREVFFTWAVVVALAQLAFHFGTNTGIKVLRARGFNQRRSLFIGNGQLASMFAERLQKNPTLGIEVLGYVAFGQDSVEDPSVLSIKNLGTSTCFKEIISESKADLIFITLSLKQSSRINELMGKLLPLHVDIHWVPDIFNLDLLNQGVYEVAGQPVLRLSDSPFVGVSRAIKWLEDKVLALIILFIISPVMLAITIAIKLTSPGPVFFKQKRIGHNGDTFITYKFRSMVIHEEESGHVSQAVQNDPRLTSIGMFLRRRSLDELPQFINVIQGTMSIVGPRPHANEHDNYFSEQVRSYMLRHRSKPGITGWAQVNGWRGQIDTSDKIEKRIEHDLFYINNWSVPFDLYIIGKTMWQMVVGKNAF